MFCRYLAVTAVSLVAIVGMRFCPRLIERPKPVLLQAEQPSTMTATERERFEELADLRSRRDGYIKIADLLAKELARGAIDLREATERLFYYCVQNYPEHLKNVSLTETGQNIKTRLARNLLRTFQSAHEDGCGGPAIDELVVRLDRELLELPYEEERAGRLEQ